jgi:hypothetical protein
MTDQVTGNNARNSTQSNKMSSSKDLKESRNIKK